MHGLDRSDLPELRSAFGGGYYAGLLKIEQKPYALIVSPRAAGEITDVCWNRFWKPAVGAFSAADGLTNTLALADAGSETAQHATALHIAGFDDWHIPARDQLELLYRNFKPTTDENAAGFGGGKNPSAPESGDAYAKTYPTQCTAP